MPFANIPGANGARLTVSGALAVPSIVATTCADVAAPKPAGTTRLIWVALLKSTCAGRPLKVTDTVWPASCEPPSVAMDPGVSGPAANVAAFTALWMEGGWTVGAAMTNEIATLRVPANGPAFTVSVAW